MAQQENLAYRITIDEGTALKSIKEMIERNKELKKILESAGASGTKEFHNLATEFSNNKKAIDDFRKGITDFATTSSTALKPLVGSYAALRKEQTELLKMLRQIPQGTQAYDLILGKVKQNQIKLDDFNRSIASSGNIVADYGRGVIQAFGQIGQSIVAGLAVGSILAFSQTLVKMQAKISDLQADIMKTANLSKDEAELLTKSLQKIDTRTSLEDLLVIGKVGGQLGIPKQQLEEFIVTLDKANVALGDEFKGGIEEIAKEVGGLQKLFKETKNLSAGKAINDIGSALNKLGASGSATAPVMAEFAKRIGALGNMAPSISQTLGLGAALQELGLTAEVSAGGLTNIFLTAGQESQRFAKVLGMSVTQFKELLNNDPNKMLLELANKFKGASNTKIIETLKYLKIGTQESIKVMSLLANQTDIVTKKQEIANQAMKEGTSLTDEFNIKNNTFAAQIEKGYKNIQELLLALSNMFAYSIGQIMSFFTDIAKGFASILPSGKDYIDVSSSIIKNSKEQATTAQTLLNEYDKLKGKTKLTTEEKQRLDEITLQLKDTLGESVVAINKETGALEVNRNAVEQAIKQKILLANQEASTLALKAKTLKDDLNVENIRNKQAQKDIEIRERLLKKYGLTVSDIDKAQNNISRNGNVLRIDQQFTGDKLKAVQKYLNEYENLKNAQNAINSKTQEYTKIMSKLKELGFSQKDIDKLFAGEVKKKEKEVPNTLGNFSDSKKAKNQAIKTAKDLLQIELDRIKETEKLRLAELETELLASKQRPVDFQIYEAKKLDIMNESNTQQITALKNYKTKEKTEIAKNNREIAELGLESLKNTKNSAEKQAEIAEKAEKDRKERVIKQLEDEQKDLQDRLFFAEAEIKEVEIIYQKGLISVETFERKKIQIRSKYAIESQKIGENFAIAIAENDYLEKDIVLIGQSTLKNEKKINQLRLQEQRKFEIEKLQIQKQSLETQLQIMREAGTITLGEELRIGNEITKINQQIALKNSEGLKEDALKKREVFEQVVNYAQQAKEIGFAFAELQLQKQLQQNEEAKKQLDQKTQESVARIDELEKKLQTASGSRKRRLLQEIEDEKNKQKEIKRQEQELDLQASQEKQRLAVIQSIINTALAVTSFLAKGDYFGAISAGILGGIQAATIKGQKFEDGGGLFPSKDGGVLKGGSHASGNDISFVVGKNKAIHKAEGGEYIVNKESTKKFFPLIDRINKAGKSSVNIPTQKFGTPYFATGGLLGLKEPQMIVNNSDVISELQAMRQEMKNLKINLSLIELQEKQIQLNEIQG